MAKTKDVGLEHVQKLKIRYARDDNKIISELSPKFGRDKSIKMLEDLYKGVDKGSNPSYTKLTENYDFAMTYIGCMDADIIRSACNWVYNHQREFGDTILEVGCNCGFMTTFLASLFPEKKIIAIDLYQSCIDIAKVNVEKFGLTNVEFINADICDLKDVSVDTVFSMRIVAELVKNKYNKPMLELLEFANAISEEIYDYAQAISRVLKDKGNLISLERLDLNVVFLSWINVLNQADLKINIDTYEQLVCKSLEKSVNIQASISNKKENLEFKPIEDFLCCCFKYISPFKPMYTGDEAKIMLLYRKGELVSGFKAINKYDVEFIKAVYFDAADETGIIVYENAGGDVKLWRYDISEKENGINLIKNECEQFSKMDGVKASMI